MTIFTVHARAAAAAAPQEDPLGLVFVKEGFCWPALFIPALWLLFRAMWLALLLWLACVAAITALARFVGGPAITVVAVLFALLFALEANQLRRWKLSRGAWRMIGISEGRNRSAAESRFFAKLDTEGLPSRLSSARPSADLWAGGRGSEPTLIAAVPRPGTSA